MQTLIFKTIRAKRHLGRVNLTFPGNKNLHIEIRMIQFASQSQNVLLIEHDSLIRNFIII